MSSVYFVQKNFGDIEPDQVIYHITVEVSGNQTQETIDAFKKLCVMFSVKIAVFLTIYFSIYFPINVVIYKWTIKVHRVVLSLILSIFALYLLIFQIKAYYYLFEYTNKFIEQNYVEPYKVLEFP